MIAMRHCLLLLVPVSLFSAGCASLVTGKHAEVGVFSNVEGASVRIQDKKGKVVATTMTPGTVALRRQRGLLRPKGYTATITAPGHQTEQFEINQKLNPWVFANLGFVQLSPLAWVIDNVNGTVWEPDDTKYYHEMSPFYGTPNGPQLSEQSPQAPSPSPDQKVQLVSSEAFVTDDEG